MKQVYCKEGTLCSKYPLEKRKIIKKALQRGFGSFLWGLLIAAIIISVASRLLSKEIVFRTWASGLMLLLSVFLAVFIVALGYEALYFKFYFYDMTEKELIIRKGVLARREVTVPFSRIQDVYVDQDILDRIFGLYDVHIATAATAVYGSERAHIDGVNFENAQALKNLIIEKIRKESTKTGV